MPSLSQRADYQTRQDSPGYSALSVPERPLHHREFSARYRNPGCVSEVKQQIIDMSLNVSEVRDTARSLHISPTTVLSELKKKEGMLESVHTALLRTLNPEKVAVDIAQAGEAEMDEMWSFVGNKGNQRWLWHAITPETVRPRRPAPPPRRAWTPLAARPAAWCCSRRCLPPLRIEHTAVIAPGVAPVVRSTARR
jgi:InsA C-terminal domain/IS1 transposase